jgi:DNA invertase Pin-like site-specific DNA recombinase
MAVSVTRRVVLGVRVSTDDKNQDPTNQLLPLRAAVARLGWIVAEEVVVEGLSAWNPKTAAEVKRRFLAPIIAGSADTLAVWALDRATRGGIGPTLAFLREVEDHLGAAIFSLQEPWASSATQDPSSRELVVSLMAWMAKQESDHKSARVRAKVHTKRNRAGALGQSAKWGDGQLASEVEIGLARNMWKNGRSVRGIAGVTGMSKSQVGRIVKGVPREPTGQWGGIAGTSPPSNGTPSGQQAETGGVVVGANRQEPKEAAGNVQVAKGQRASL